MPRIPVRSVIRVLLAAGTCVLPAFLWNAAVAAENRLLREEAETFIEEMASKHAFDRAELRRVFRDARFRPEILRAISTPATTRPWHEFRDRLIDEARVSGGVRFWTRNAPALERASREYGVPPEIIVATIGIETFYGRHMGRWRVLDALTTLAFDYPPRAGFFRGELEQFLLLARETGSSALELRGSYAGAIGIPQFLPSSYRRYAVDFDGDGRIDLVNSVEDAIGSIANYYRAFGWQQGAPVAVRAVADESGAADILAAGIKPRFTVAELRERRVLPVDPVEEKARAALLRLELEQGPQYWLGLQNFYVITRYNRSINYAMAVRELAREIRARIEAEGIAGE